MIEYKMNPSLDDDFDKKPLDNHLTTETPKENWREEWGNELKKDLFKITIMHDNIPVTFISENDCKHALLTQRQDIVESISEIITEYFEASTYPIPDPAVLNGYIRAELSDLSERIGNEK